MPVATLAPVPPLEINAMQSWLTSQAGIVTKIIGKIGNAVTKVRLTTKLRERKNGPWYKLAKELEL